MKESEIQVKSLTSTVERNDISRQVDDVDAFGADYDSVVLATPYSLNNLATIIDQSNTLPQCIEAMVVNTTRFGTRVIPINDKVEIDEGESDLLQSYITSANTEESLSSVQAKAIEDYERYGFAFYEVIRDARGRPTLLRHAKAFNLRLMRKAGDAVPVTIEVLRGGRRSKVTERKKFRKYLQISGTSKSYFKEFGDTRNMSFKTGMYETKENKIAKEDRATEILHHRQYSEDSYGLPRWISQLPSILGSRESEEVNLRYFEDNTVPACLLSVAGGRLTRQSFQDLNRLLKAKGVGKDRQNQILLIEAIPETTGLDEKGSVSLRIDKLTDQRPSDGLFKAYDDANIAKICSAFRFPPLIIGISGAGTTFASASVFLYIAESQVFAPERSIHDEFINKTFVNHPQGLNLKTVKLESRGPSIENPDQIVKALSSVNSMGGVTPRSSISLVNEMMQLSIPQYPLPDADGYESWMDKPLVLGIREIGDTQQTGETVTPDDLQGLKSPDVKEIEDTGETGLESQTVEHGNEAGTLENFSN